MKKVEIILGKDGSIKTEAFGFKGSTCEEATAFIDELFGYGERNHKPEYFESDEITGILGEYCG